MNRRVFLLTAAAGPLAAASDAAYGPELRILSGLGIGMAAAAAVAGNWLYVIGGGAAGSLYVFDIAVPAVPKLVSKLAGLGHVRQLQVRRGIAYVTCREDGLFLIDVSRPARPAILSHYDTIELATGIALSGNVAFIACRHCGVEQIDVSNPRRPKHLSTIRVGEAQSVAARNGYMYAGVWATRELVVCDVRDPRRPSRAGRADLDGYGDGVALHGNLCLVATGHHSGAAGYQRPKPNGPGYGLGHGLEIFDISQPAQPHFLSRVKAPQRYRVFMDMWSVQVAGRYAFLADTYNGLFMVDISDPSEPRFIGHRQLPEVPARGEGYVVLPGETVPSPVSGFALTRDHVYVSGGYSDLHVLAAPGIAAAVAPEPDRAPNIPRASSAPADPRYGTYSPGGQVHEIVRWGDHSDGSARFVLACGSAGFLIVRFAGQLESVARYPAEDIAFGAAVAGDKVYVADGMGGLAIWGGDNKLKLIGRYRVPGQSVKQVVVDPSGRYAMLHIGLHRLEIVDVSDPGRPGLILSDAHFGLFYRRPLSQLLSKGQGLAVWTEGLYQYDLSGNAPPRGANYRYPFAITARNGAAPYRDGWLVTGFGKYFIVRPGEDRPPERVGLRSVEGCELSGKPTIAGNTLFVADALGGRVSAIDITDVSNPKLYSAMNVPEHPGHIIAHEGLALVPAGYQGLLLWQYHNISSNTRARSKM